MKRKKDACKTISIYMPIDARADENRLYIENVFKEILIIVPECFVVSFVSEFRYRINGKLVQSSKDLRRIVVQVFAVLEKTF